jgi:hypothetical protein
MIIKTKSPKDSIYGMRKPTNSLMNSGSLTKNLLLLKKGKGSPEASINEERSPYQSTISFENKIINKAKIAFDHKNPLREKRSVYFNLPSENNKERKNSSIIKKKN